MSIRHYDHGYPLLYWATQVEVICPTCGGVGVINGNPSWSAWSGAFFCRHCCHAMSTKRDRWTAALLARGRRPCASCGHKWVYAEQRFDTPKSVKSLIGFAPCPVCDSRNEIELSFTRDAPADHAIDPYFGLPLALQAETRHGVVWVYGAPHLAELTRYISASLREGNCSKWSYFTRLPTWLKRAKNRALVLKAIDKLDKQLSYRTVDEKL